MLEIIILLIIIALSLLKPKKVKNFMITKKDGKDVIYKSIWSLNGLVRGPTPPDKTEAPTTLYELLQYVLNTFEHKELFGYRTLYNIIKETRHGKTFSYYHLSHYEWMTAGVFYEKATSFGKYLAQAMEEKDILCIFASTSVEWQIVAHAAWSQNITISTAYDTLGADGLLHSLKETEADVLYCTSDQFEVLIQVLPNYDLSTVYFKQGLNTTEEETSAYIETLEDYCMVIQLDDAIEAGMKLDLPARPPQTTDVACIMYTSGSTGHPKGVVISHANMMATIGSGNAMLDDSINSDDILIAYLPLAHILELSLETCCMAMGIRMGYGSPRTLTEQFTRRCQGDLNELGPTVMAGVPLVWDTIKKEIMGKVLKTPKPVQAIFWGAVWLKQFSVKHGLPTAKLADVFFKKIRQQTGGNLKVALSGGAKLNNETQMFLTTVLCPIYVGYGLTETMGMGCLLTPAAGHMPGVVGFPVPSLELKLVNVEDAGYFTTSNPPQGEIWLRGPSICVGYYKQPEKTAQDITKDGWFKTGDIAEIAPLDTSNIQKHNEVNCTTGVLRIIDRKKNLVKLSNGEYIALESLESVYKQHPMAVNVMVTANTECKLPVIVVQVKEPMYKAFAEKHGKQVTVAFLKSLRDTGKEYDLKGTKLVGGVVISEEEWTPQNGMLTAAMKLHRRSIEKTYKRKIDEAFAVLK